MKTTTNTELLHRELTQNTLAYLYESLETIRHEIQTEYTYNIDENGFLTKEARERILQLEQQERDAKKNIKVLEMQRDGFSPAKNIPSYTPDIEDNEFDFVRLLDQLEEERRTELALKEIQEARDRSQSIEKDYELTR
ncbi:MAG: hypothetical protein F9K23_08550 [Bacteroidetes bacterium]|nr:MAG: hypothetical protein F9K23_08550 [Bacteroidota bacterium]